MVLKKLVTGYIPIRNHPRAAEEYGRLGEDMFPKLDCVAGNFSIHPYYENVKETWLAKLLNDGIDFTPTPSVADNPQKNTLAYHCVQHQKFAWLLKAAIADPTPEVFVWMDYGIGHVPGVTPDVVSEFMAGVQTSDFAIPGCWTKTYALENGNYLWPNWRFCGGLMVVPRNKIHKLYKAVKAEVRRHVLDTSNLTWEVNTLAKIEPTLGVRWYQADHNETMFTNYKIGAPCPKPSELSAPSSP